MRSLSETDLAKKLWDYLNYRTPLIKSDAIIVLCSHDIRIAAYAAKLFHDGWAPTLVFTGGLSRFTSKIYKNSEAEAFAEVAQSMGVPNSSIIIETQSTNTQENLEFTMSQLKKLGHVPSTAILVQKPNMLRRVYATAKKLFPEIEFTVTSHEIEFNDAPHNYVSKDILIHELVGDIQRIKIYAERGFINAQEMDPDIWEAFSALVDKGYAGNLVK